MARSIASNALTIFIVLLLAAASIAAWARAQYANEGPLEAAICQQVPSGSSMAALSEALFDKGAITNATIFRLGADYSERANKLKAGSFVIEPGASMDEIIEAVTASGRSTCGTEINYRIGVNRTTMRVRELDPQTQEYVELANFVPGEEAGPENLDQIIDDAATRFRVTLAEGVTSWNVAEALKTASFLDGEIAAVPAEGALAPGSYEFGHGEGRTQLLTEMATRQSEILNELWQVRNPAVPLETPEEALTLASIVEKETGVAAERPQVSSVFVNRLNQGMRLQTDPTVIYGLTEGKESLGRGLRQSELRKATPYNTYVIVGLPPTPIANPGRASIEAALNPAETDYLFFVADGTGGHAFATTLAEHNQNVAKWRAIEAERANQ